MIKTEMRNPATKHIDTMSTLEMLKVIQEEGDEIMLSTLDSEEEMDAVYEQFMETLFADEEE